MCKCPTCGQPVTAPFGIRDLGELELRMYAALLLHTELACYAMAEELYGEQPDGGPLCYWVCVHDTKKRLNRKIAVLGQRVVCGRGRYSTYRLESFHAESNEAKPADLIRW